jgi:hypothetical protein
LALKSDGTVVGWGDNSWGEITPPPGLNSVTQISAGYYHSVALKSDGTVVAWGQNNFGQTNVPAGLSGVIQIAVGQYHNLALKTDGTVVAWGSDSTGQTDVPYGLNSVTQVAAGRWHSLAVRSNGAVIGWGSHTNGECSAPADLPGPIQISAGESRSYALVPAPAVAVSRKNHGDAGSFDIDLPLSGTPAVECRSGGVTNDHQIVVSYVADVTVDGNPQAAVTSGMGTIGTGGISNGGTVTIDGNVVIIPLTNVANAQTINVTLFGVNSGGNLVIPVSVLEGDASGNGVVNAADVSFVKAYLGQGVSSTNFRADVNVNGLIDASDICVTKSTVGSGLP